VVVILDSSFRHVGLPQVSSFSGKLAYSLSGGGHNQCTVVYFPSDVAYEDVENKQGLLSRAAVLGLQGQPANNTGQITWQSLAAYMKVEVDKESVRLRGMATEVQTAASCPDFVIGTVTGQT
jgi:hypothetical protein